MKAKRFSEEQIIAVLKEAEAGAKTKEQAETFAQELEASHKHNH
jgi:hypothetical protein